MENKIKSLVINVKENSIREKSVSEFFKKLIIVIITQFIFATGESIFLCSEVGLESIGVLFYGMSIALGVSYGTAINFFNIGAFILVLFIYRKSIYFGTVVNVLIYGMVFDFIQPLIDSIYPTDPEMWFRILGPLVGIVLIGVALALYIPIDWGITTFDAIMMWFKEVTKLRYTVAFLIINLTITVIGYFLGSELIIHIGYGTIISILFTGMVFDYSRKPVQFITRKILRLPPYVETSK